LGVKVVAPKASRACLGVAEVRPAPVRFMATGITVLGPDLCDGFSDFNSQLDLA
jgi:hypothetical protein